jgi:hypothetical protein
VGLDLRCVSMQGVQQIARRKFTCSRAGEFIPGDLSSSSFSATASSAFGLMVFVVRASSASGFMLLVVLGDYRGSLLGRCLSNCCCTDNAILPNFDLLVQVAAMQQAAIFPGRSENGSLLVCLFACLWLYRSSLSHMARRLYLCNGKRRHRESNSN